MSDTCPDCGSENIRYEPNPANPQVSLAICEDCGEVF